LHTEFEVAVYKAHVLILPMSDELFSIIQNSQHS